MASTDGGVLSFVPKPRKSKKMYSHQKLSTSTSAPFVSESIRFVCCPLSRSVYIHPSIPSCECPHHCPHLRIAPVHPRTVVGIRVVVCLLTVRLRRAPPHAGFTPCRLTADHGRFHVVYLRCSTHYVRTAVTCILTLLPDHQHRVHHPARPRRHRARPRRYRAYLFVHPPLR